MLCQLGVAPAAEGAPGSDRAHLVVELRPAHAAARVAETDERDRLGRGGAVLIGRRCVSADPVARVHRWRGPPSFASRARAGTDRGPAGARGRRSVATLDAWEPRPRGVRPPPDEGLRMVLAGPPGCAGGWATRLA